MAGQPRWSDQFARRRVYCADPWAGSAVEKELVSAVKLFLKNTIMLIEQKNLTAVREV